jgi:alpha/beta superfamily hydrolase
MKVPPEVKPACLGAVIGALALAVIGFSWGGWVTGATADAKAKEASKAAAVNVLAPICVQRFEQQADASAKLVELKRTSSWERAKFVEQGGWATLAGNPSPHDGVARACAELLEKSKV